VVSDGAPDVTGLHEVDGYVQTQLILAVLNICTYLLQPGGTMCAKIFKGEGYQLLENQLRIFFKDVVCFKPASSRPKSAEHFVVCTGFSFPEGYVPAVVLLSSLFVSFFYVGCFVVNIWCLFGCSRKITFSMCIVVCCFARTAVVDQGRGADLRHPARLQSRLLALRTSILLFTRATHSPDQNSTHTSHSLVQGCQTPTRACADDARCWGRE
jgi:hypothetical protein